LGFCPKGIELFRFSLLNANGLQVNFLLKNLELELDEHHLLVGEKLLEDGKVVRLFESERNLWIAGVESLEVEMQISPSRVKACSCECGVFQHEKMCGHVAAGLLALRRHLTEKKATPSTPAAKKTTHYQRLTTSAILDNARPEDLAAFVRNYAKSNRNFALALKARFASNVPMPDSQEKYGQLLDATIVAGRGKNDRISSAGRGQLVKTLQELLGQAEDAVALEHFAEGWAMLSSILEKTTPVLRKITGDDEPVRKAIREVFKSLKSLTEQQIPPALRQEIWEFCFESLPRPAFRLNDLTAPLLKLLLALCDDVSKSESLLQLLDQELSKKPHAETQVFKLLQTKILLLEREDMTRHSENFTLECLATPQTLLTVVEAANAGGLLKNIKPLIEKGLRLVESEAVKKQLEQALLRLAHEQGDRKIIVSIAGSRFLETRNFDYFEICKENFQGDWDVFVQKLLADLIKQPDYQQNIETIATLLARENRLDDLLKLLTDQDSLDLFMRFDHLLIEKYREEVFGFYDRQLKNYLSNHLGPVPSHRVRHILDHLRACNAGKMAEKIAASLLESFNNRLTLAEELSV
jgi:hypothetical protein